MSKIDKAEKHWGWFSNVYAISEGSLALKVELHHTAHTLSQFVRYDYLLTFETNWSSCWRYQVFFSLHYLLFFYLYSLTFALFLFVCIHLSSYGQRFLNLIMKVIQFRELLLFCLSEFNVFVSKLLSNLILSDNLSFCNQLLPLSLSIWVCQSIF